MKAGIVYRAAVLIFAISEVQLCAAVPLSPEDAVAEALRSYQSIAAGAARIRVAEGLKQQAGLKPNPRLILQSENARVRPSTPFQYSRDADTFAYASQLFERGRKRESRVELADENLRASEVSLIALQTQIASRVLTSYWTALGTQQLETALAETVRNLERTLQYHRDRVREGSLPEADLIRIQLEYQQIAINYQNAKQESRRQVLLLFREMGVPERPDITLTGELAAVPQLTVSNLEEAVERRPDVRTARQGVEQARAALQLQRANAVPDPEVLAGYKRTGGFDTLIAGLQINLPFRNRNQGAIGAAAAEESAATASLQAARTAARTEITALLGEYEQKQQIVRTLIPNMRLQANETRRIAEAVYREGASDLLRLLDAERVRLQAETLYIRTVTDYRQASINLQIALGVLP